MSLEEYVIEYRVHKDFTVTLLSESRDEAVELATSFMTVGYHNEPDERVVSGPDLINMEYEILEVTRA